MKKIILFVIVLLMVLPPLAQSRELTIKRASQLGPEKGSFTKFLVLKLGEKKNHQIKDSINGGLLINEDKYRSEDTIVAQITAVGDCSNETILAAYLHPGVTVHSPYFQTKETEDGFSHWGFSKKRSLNTEIKSARRLPQTSIIVVTTNIVTKEFTTFFGWSIVILIISFISGLIVADLIIELVTVGFTFKSIWKIKGEDFCLSLAWIFAVSASVSQSLKSGWQFSILTLAVFVSAALIVAILRNSKNKKSKK